MYRKNSGHFTVWEDTSKVGYIYAASAPYAEYSPERQWSAQMWTASGKLVGGHGRYALSAIKDTLENARLRGLAQS